MVPCQEQGGQGKRNTMYGLYLQGAYNLLKKQKTEHEASITVMFKI